MSRLRRLAAPFGRVWVAGLIPMMVASCGPRLSVRPTSKELVRLQVVRLQPHHDPEGVESVLRHGGSFDHAVLVHSPDEEEVLFRPWDRTLALAVLGDWLAYDDPEPVPGALAWAEGAQVGEVQVLEVGGAGVLVRLAGRVEAGGNMLAPALGELLDALGGHRVRRSLQRDSPAVLLDASDVIDRLETTADRPAAEWAEQGPRWIALARLVGSDALGMRVLWLWSSALHREHRLRESAELLAALLDLAERHRLSDRARGLIARELASEYQHGLAPFRGMEALGGQLQVLSEEGRYIVLTALAEQLEDLGLTGRAHSVLDEAETLAPGLRHVHGANHHLVRARLLAGADRLAEALPAAEAAERFALKVMHVNDHVEAGRLRARILLELGHLEAAGELASISLERTAALAGHDSDPAGCPLPALRLLRDVRQAQGDPTAVKDLEGQILAHVRHRHGPLDASAEVSRLAAGHLARGSERGLILFEEARSLSRRMGVDHVAPEARIALLRWSVRTGRERPLADEVASELFRSFHRGGLLDAHLPLVQTAAKESELAAGFELMRYWLARGDQLRAVRSAERLLVNNVRRSLLVLASRPRRLDWLSTVGDGRDDEETGIRQAAGNEPRHASGAARVDPTTRLRLEALASRLDTALGEEEPYPYGRILGSGDLFVAFLLDGDEAYRLSSFRGVPRLERLGGLQEPPARQLRRLQDEVIALGSETRRSQAGERAAAEAYRLLFGGLERELDLADRLLVSPGPDLTALPFGLLRTGSGYLAFQRPIVYVDTGLPLALGDLAGGPEPAASVLFADPFGDLPATREALTAAVSSLQDARLELGPGASEVALWRLRGRLQLLHLDTHARLELRRGVHQVVLRLAAGDGEDGDVLLEEWLHRLRATPRIVSLLACQSGASRYPESRDLDRPGAMLAALGVPWVLTTFWRVADESSACLASGLVPRLAAGDSPDAALFQTLLELHERCPPASPSQWAPYRLSVSELRGGVSWRTP